jgi:hypothetical protein
MTLPPRALQALVDIKKELLARDEPKIILKVQEISYNTFRQAHAKPPNAFQRACQRHEFYTPVY